MFFLYNFSFQLESLEILFQIIDKVKKQNTKAAIFNLIGVAIASTFKTPGTDEKYNQGIYELIRSESLISKIGDIFVLYGRNKENTKPELNNECELDNDFLFALQYCWKSMLIGDPSLGLFFLHSTDAYIRYNLEKFTSISLVNKIYVKLLFSFLKLPS